MSQGQWETDWVGELEVLVGAAVCGFREPSELVCRRASPPVAWVDARCLMREVWSEAHCVRRCRWADLMVLGVAVWLWRLSHRCSHSRHRSERSKRLERGAADEGVSAVVLMLRMMPMWMRMLMM